MIRYGIRGHCNPFDEGIQRLLSGPLGLWYGRAVLGRPSFRVFCLRSPAASNFSRYL